MDGSHDSMIAHRDREPMPICLTRPSSTLPPAGGEGRGEGARFMGSLHGLLFAHGNHEPPGRGTRLGTRPTGCRPRALTRRFLESLNFILRLAARKVWPAILLASWFRL